MNKNLTIEKNTSKKLKKKIVQKNILNGGNNVFSATYEVFSSLISLGENMATEFDSIKNLPAQLNNGSPPISGQPNSPK